MAIPAAAAILLKALPQVANVAKVYINRPMKDQYVQDTSYLNNYMDYLKGKKSERQIERMLMEPGLREIGREAGRIQRQNEYFANKYGYVGSGVDAQMKLSEQQNRLAAIGALSEKAGLAQAQENIRLDDTLAQIEMEKERIKTQGEQSYKTAKKQWQRNLLGSLVGAGTSIAGGLLSDKIAKEKSSAFLNTAEKIATGQITKIEDIDKSQYDTKQYEELAKMVINRNGAEFQRGEQILNRIETEFNPSESDMDAIIKSLPEEDRSDPDKIYGAAKSYFTEQEISQTGSAYGIDVPANFRKSKTAANAYIRNILEERRNAESPIVNDIWNDFYNGATVEDLQSKYADKIQTKEERVQFNSALNAINRQKSQISKKQEEITSDIKKQQESLRKLQRLGTEISKVEFEDGSSGSVYRDQLLDIMQDGAEEMNRQYGRLIDLVDKMSKNVKVNVNESTITIGTGENKTTISLDSLAGKDIQSKIANAQQRYYEKTMNTIDNIINNYLKYDNSLLNQNNVQTQSPAATLDQEKDIIFNKVLKSK